MKKAKNKKEEKRKSQTIWNSLTIGDIETPPFFFAFVFERTFIF